jgi:hypothetical protein
MSYMSAPCTCLMRARLFIRIWFDQLVQNVMHVIQKNLGHVSERQLSYDVGKKVVRVCSLERSPTCRSGTFVQTFLKVLPSDSLSSPKGYPSQEAMGESRGTSHAAGLVPSLNRDMCDRG